MADVGTGTTITFATSSFSAVVLNVSQDGISRPAKESTSMATTNYREFIPGRLIDGGTIEIEMLYDPEAQPPIAGAAESIVIEFPTTLTTGAKLTFTGFATDWSWGDPVEELMTSTVTIKVDGVTTEPTWTAAA